jgi:hypothetical protein
LIIEDHSAKRPAGFQTATAREEAPHPGVKPGTGDIMNPDFRI